MLIFLVKLDDREEHGVDEGVDLPEQIRPLEALRGGVISDQVRTELVTKSLK